MALYTFESPVSIQRATDKLVMVDSSYFIALNAPSDQFNASVTPFHKTLQTNTDTTFYINVIVRLECIRQIRKGHLQNCMSAFVAKFPATERVYRKLAPKLSPSDPIGKIISRKFDAFYKHHVKQGDIDVVLSMVQADLWKEQTEAERLLDLEYYPGSSPEMWIALGSLFDGTLMDPTDAMIANAAVFHNMDAILTCDCDYAKIADRTDVYLPAAVARTCTGIYDQAADHRL